jgi:hypothetical protein
MTIECSCKEREDSLKFPAYRHNYYSNRKKLIAGQLTGKGAVP